VKAVTVVDGHLNGAPSFAAHGSKPRPLGFSSLAELRSPSLVALTCCHDRRETTLRGIRSLELQTGGAINIAVVLFDDGSSDGTSAAVREAFPTVTVVRGDGENYWSRSMAVAQQHALRVSQPDYLLWLNDDVVLLPGATDLLVSAAKAAGDLRVIAGATVDESSGQTTYSGLRRFGRRPLQLRRVSCSGAVEAIATFNGNVVLVPRAIYQCVGPVDGRYQHAFGDIDYGYRVSAHGFGSLLAAGPVGYCDRNSEAGTWRDTSLAVGRRVSQLFARKGLPVRSHARFLRRHGGRYWPFLLAASYLMSIWKILTSSVLNRARLRPWKRSEG
jgi:GT2 family glycosyltransferase